MPMVGHRKPAGRSAAWSVTTFRAGCHGWGSAMWRFGSRSSLGAGRGSRAESGGLCVKDGGDAVLEVGDLMVDVGEDVVQSG